MLEVDPGFNPADVLTFRVSLPPAKYQDAAAHDAFYQTVLERIGALTDVVAAGVTGALPLTGTPATTMEPEGSNATEQLSADVITATPGFFGVLQIPLRQGRLLASTDTRDGHAVAIVNEAAAQRFWPDDASALGRTITMKDWGAPYQAEVVGVVGSVRQSGPDTEVSPAVYYPFAQFPETTLSESIVVRATGNLQRTVAAVKDQVWTVDPNQPIAAIRTMNEIMAASVAERRFNLLLLSAFALAAILLSAVGIYGIVAFAVTERTQEIGVRMALGAQAQDLAILVLRHGARPVVAGIVAAQRSHRRIAAARDAAVRCAPDRCLDFVRGVASRSGCRRVHGIVRRATRVDPSPRCGSVVLARSNRRREKEKTQSSLSFSFSCSVWTMIQRRRTSLIADRWKLLAFAQRGRSICEARRAGSHPAQIVITPSATIEVSRLAGSLGVMLNSIASSRCPAQRLRKHPATMPNPRARSRDGKPTTDAALAPIAMRTPISVRRR